MSYDTQNTDKPIQELSQKVGNDRLSKVLDYERDNRVSMVQSSRMNERLRANKTAAAMWRNNARHRCLCDLRATLRRDVLGIHSTDHHRPYGCTVADLCKHISDQFKHGMAWENYGERWEVDHVVACQRFNLPSEAAACFHYTNLRPLTVGLNRLKR